MDIATIQHAFFEFTKKVNRLLQAREFEKGSVELADDADTLGGLTPTQLKDQAAQALTDHENARNPHGVSLAALNGVNRSYVDSRIGNTLSLSSIMVSQYGDISEVPITYSTSGFTFSITQSVPCVVNGLFKQLEPISINLAEQSYSYQNQRILMYVLYEEDIRYVITPDLLSEDDYTIYLGYIQTNASGITHVELNKVSRIGTYRFSKNNIGSSVPISDENGNLPYTIN